MNKNIIISVILGVSILSACSKQAEQTIKNSSDSSSSEIESISSSSIVSQNEAVNQQQSSVFGDYSAEQIEYARATEELMNYYKITEQPVAISVVKNGENHPVFPFVGSVTVPQATITLSFSTDNTMAGTVIVTYSSNHNGSINFYRDPNHYQDERYIKDSDWVKQESQKLLDSTQTLEISITYDSQAAQIISKIQVQ